MRKEKKYPYHMILPLECLPERLPGWYAENHRQLPWRDTGDPYDVWLSEIMLQQTRAAAVTGYFNRFRQALPDIAHLASCDEERLLKLWEGLGYYSRVRNLKKAAGIVMNEYGGALPETAEELQKLPGIGSYTAGAIASIAFGKPVPAVDGNVMRICARISGSGDDIARQDTKKALEQELTDVFLNCASAVHPGTLNQAMMELGATVCVPNGDPLCAVCPVSDCCYAYREKRWNALPVKSAKKPRRIEKRTVLLIREGDRWIIRKRPKKGLLAGLWELPSAEGFLTEEQAIAAANELLAGTFDPLFIKKLQPARHIFTHIEWHMEAYMIRVAETVPTPGKGPADDSLRFVTAEELREIYSLPSAFSAWTKQITD